EESAGGLVVDSLLPQRLRYAHHKCAVYLTLGCLEVDHDPTVLHGHHFLNRDYSGFEVDRDIGHLNPANAAVRAMPPTRLRLPSDGANAPGTEFLTGLPPTDLPVQICFHGQTAEAAFNL